MERQRNSKQARKINTETLFEEQELEQINNFTFLEERAREVTRENFEHSQNEQEMRQSKHFLGTKTKKGSRNAFV